MSRTAHHESMKTSRGFGVGGRKRIFFTTHYPLSTNHYFHRSEERLLIPYSLLLAPNIVNFSHSLRFSRLLRFVSIA